MPGPRFNPDRVILAWSCRHSPSTGQMGKEVCPTSNTSWPLGRIEHLPPYLYLERRISGRAGAAGGACGVGLVDPDHDRQSQFLAGRPPLWSRAFFCRGAKNDSRRHCRHATRPDPRNPVIHCGTVNKRRLEIGIDSRSRRTNGPEPGLFARLRSATRTQPARPSYGS